MRKLLIGLVGGATLAVSGIASAVPFTTGFSLLEATPGKDSTLCLDDGCRGTITIEFSDAGGPSNQEDGFYDITAIDIFINETAGGTPELTFGALAAQGNYVQVQGGQITDLFATASSNNNHSLVASVNDWVINPLDPVNQTGTLHFGGGSSARIPEPSSIALLGMGLLAFGAASMRMRRGS